MIVFSLILLVNFVFEGVKATNYYQYRYNNGYKLFIIISFYFNDNFKLLSINGTYF